MTTDQISTLTIHDSTKNPNNGRIEGGSVTLHSIPVTTGNIVDQTTDFTTLRDAINAVQLGTNYSQQFAGFHTELANPDLPAANILAQRENTWLIRMREEVTFKPRRFSIPCADLSLLTANRELMDGTLAVAIALEAAIVTFVNYDGNAVTISDILFKGKNL